MFRSNKRLYLDDALVDSIFHSLNSQTVGVGKSFTGPSQHNDFIKKNSRVVSLIEYPSERISEFLEETLETHSVNSEQFTKGAFCLMRLESENDRMLLFACKHTNRRSKQLEFFPAYRFYYVGVSSGLQALWPEGCKMELVNKQTDESHTLFSSKLKFDRMVKSMGFTSLRIYPFPFNLNFNKFKGNSDQKNALIMVSVFTPLKFSTTENDVLSRLEDTAYMRVKSRILLNLGVFLNKSITEGLEEYNFKKIKRRERVLVYLKFLFTRNMRKYYQPDYISIAEFFKENFKQLELQSFDNDFSENDSSILEKFDKMVAKKNGIYPCLTENYEFVLVVKTDHSNAVYTYDKHMILKEGRKDEYPSSSLYILKSDVFFMLLGKKYIDMEGYKIIHDTLNQSKSKIEKLSKLNYLLEIMNMKQNIPNSLFPYEIFMRIYQVMDLILINVNSTSLRDNLEIQDVYELFLCLIRMPLSRASFILACKQMRRMIYNKYNLNIPATKSEEVVFSSIVKDLVYINNILWLTGSSDQSNFFMRKIANSSNVIKSDLYNIIILVPLHSQRVYSPEFAILVYGIWEKPIKNNHSDIYKERVPMDDSVLLVLGTQRIIISRSSADLFIYNNQNLLIAKPIPSSRYLFINVTDHQVSISSSMIKETMENNIDVMRYNDNKKLLKEIADTSMASDTEKIKKEIEEFESRRLRASSRFWHKELKITNKGKEEEVLDIQEMPSSSARLLTQDWEYFSTQKEPESYNELLFEESDLLGIPTSPMSQEEDRFLSNFSFDADRNSQLLEYTEIGEPSVLSNPVSNQNLFEKFVMEFNLFIESNNLLEQSQEIQLGDISLLGNNRQIEVQIEQFEKDLMDLRYMMYNQRLDTESAMIDKNNIETMLYKLRNSVDEFIVENDKKVISELEMFQDDYGGDLGISEVVFSDSNNGQLKNQILFDPGEGPAYLEEPLSVSVDDVLEVEIVKKAQNAAIGTKNPKAFLSFGLNVLYPYELSVKSKQKAIDKPNNLRLGGSVSMFGSISINTELIGSVMRKVILLILVNKDQEKIYFENVDHYGDMDKALMEELKSIPDNLEQVDKNFPMAIISPLRTNFGVFNEQELLESKANYNVENYRLTHFDLLILYWWVSEFLIFQSNNEPSMKTYYDSLFRKFKGADSLKYLYEEQVPVVRRGDQFKVNIQHGRSIQFNTSIVCPVFSSSEKNKVVKVAYLPKLRVGYTGYSRKLDTSNYISGPILLKGLDVTKTYRYNLFEEYNNMEREVSKLTHIDTFLKYIQSDSFSSIYFKSENYNIKWSPRHAELAIEGLNELFGAKVNLHMMLFVCAQSLFIKTEEKRIQGFPSLYSFYAPVDCYVTEEPINQYVKTSFINKCMKALTKIKEEKLHERYVDFRLINKNLENGVIRSDLACPSFAINNIHMINASTLNQKVSARLKKLGRQPLFSKFNYNLHRSKDDELYTSMVLNNTTTMNVFDIEWVIKCGKDVAMNTVLPTALSGCVSQWSTVDVNRIGYTLFPELKSVLFPVKQYVWAYCTSVVKKDLFLEDNHIVKTLNYNWCIIDTRKCGNVLRYVRYSRYKEQSNVKFVGKQSIRDSNLVTDMSIVLQPESTEIADMHKVEKNETVNSRIHGNLYEDVKFWHLETTKSIQKGAELVVYYDKNMERQRMYWIDIFKHISQQKSIKKDPVVSLLDAFDLPRMKSSL